MVLKINSYAPWKCKNKKNDFNPKIRYKFIFGGKMLKCYSEIHIYFIL